MTLPTGWSEYANQKRTYNPIVKWRNNDLQSTSQKTKDQVIRTPIKRWGSWMFGRVSRSCSISDIHRITLKQKHHMKWKSCWTTASVNKIQIPFVRRVWRYQRVNHNLYIEEEQTTQWQKEKGQKDKQRSTKHTCKTTDRVTRTSIKFGGEHNSALC